MTSALQIKAFFHKDTSTLTYLVWDEATADAAIIDPVLDYEPASSTYSTPAIDEVLDFAAQNKLNIRLSIETHAHADHLTASQVIKSRIPSVKLAIGANIRSVQDTFKTIYNLEDGFATDGSQWDILVEDGGKVSGGSLEFEAIYTPGHTDSCYCYKIGDAVFVGDTLFMPDFGVARCDFPKGSAELLYDSVTKRLYTLPGHTRLFTAHDYQPGGRELRYEFTVAESKEGNILLNGSTSREEFVQKRTAKDKTLGAPRLLLPSIQVNIDAGKIPDPEPGSSSFLKIPINPA